MANNIDKFSDSLNNATKSARASAAAMKPFNSLLNDITYTAKIAAKTFDDLKDAINIESQLSKIGKEMKNQQDVVDKYNKTLKEIYNTRLDLNKTLNTSDQNFLDAINKNLSQSDAKKALELYNNYKDQFEKYKKSKEDATKKGLEANYLKDTVGVDSKKYEEAHKAYLEALVKTGSQRIKANLIRDNELYNFILDKTKDKTPFTHWNRDFFKIYDKILDNSIKEIVNKYVLQSEELKLSKIAEQYEKLSNQFEELKNALWDDVWGLFAPLKTVFQRYVIELDHAGAHFRKGMGLMTDESKSAEIQIRRLSTELAHMGASSDDIARAQVELSGHLTGMVGLQDEIVSKTVQWNKQFNIAYDTSAKFLKTLAGVSGTTIKAQTAMIGFAKEMSNAAQVPLNQVMSDVANASDDVRIFMGQSEVSLIKAAVEARHLGVTMNDLASTAKSLLNFESSITAELRASALIGQHLDFNNARRLAFNRDTVGTMEEIKRLANQVDFNNLNVIQQEQFARAAGVSVEKLQTMLQREKDLNWIRTQGSEKQKEQLRNLERMKAMRDNEAKDVAKRAAKEIELQANQERLNQLGAAWAKMMREVVGPAIEKIVIPLLNIATKVLPPVINMVGYMIPALFKIGVFLKQGAAHIHFITVNTTKLADKLLNIAVVFEKLSKLIPLGVIASRIAKVSSTIFNISLFVSKIGFGFLKWVPILGWTVSIVESIIHGITHFEKISQKFGGGFLGGLMAVGNEIIRVVLGPFTFIWDWIVDKFVGKSPSKLGLGIVNGLKSVGGMIVDVLISPFKIWYKLFTNIWGSVLNLISTVTPNWMKSIFGYGSNTAITTPVITEQKVESDLNLPENDKKPGELSYHEQFNKIIEYNKNNNEVISKLNETLTLLTELLADGNIGISIDGAKLNYALSNHKALFGDLGKMSKISN